MPVNVIFIFCYSKAEQELINVRKKHEEALQESTKSIDALKSLVEVAEKEKGELNLQLEEERRYT